jgi:hypothetical protein
VRVTPVSEIAGAGSSTGPHRPLSYQQYVLIIGT